jgi:flagellar biosynthesis/type III secretory pathway M-ring protein FliF/YscJ
MLNEMEEDLETAEQNLSLVTRKTKELIQKSGGKRNFIIIVALSVVMIILFFLVLYT